MKKLRSLFAIVLVIAMLFSLSIVYSSADAINDYASLVAAIEAADAGDTITLTGTVSFDYEDGDGEADVIIDKDLTIDLNGNVVQYAGDDGSHAFEIQGANVVVKDSSAGTGYFRLVFGDDCSLFHVKDNGTLTADNLTMCIEDEDNTAFSAYCGNIIINSGSYDILNSSYVFCSNGENDNHSTITIKDNGEFNNIIDNHETTIGEVSNTDLTIENGTFSGFYCGIYVKSGSATINGGTFNTNGVTLYTIEEYGDPTDLTINGGTFHSKDGVVLSLNGGNATINDGDFLSDNNIAVNIFNYANYHKDNKVEINGGTFKTTAPQPEVFTGLPYICTVDASYMATPQGEEETYKLPLVINGGTFTASYAPALRIQNDLTITGGTFSGLSSAACFANMYSSNINEISLSGGTYIARARTADDDTYAPEDYFYLGDTSIVSGISFVDYRGNVTPASFIPSGYTLYGTNKKVESFVSYEVHDMYEYYTNEATLVISPDAKILTGDNAEIDKEDIANTLFKSNIDFSFFKEVKVDGKTVDSKNYTAAAGSTDITLKASFLNTLDVGEHTLQIISEILGNEVVAETTFTITEEEPEEEPTEEPTEEPVEEPTEEPTEEPVEEPDDKIADTADTTVVSAFVAIGTLSVAGYIVLKKKED